MGSDSKRRNGHAAAPDPGAQFLEGGMVGAVLRADQPGPLPYLPVSSLGGAQVLPVGSVVIAGSGADVAFIKTEPNSWSYTYKDNLSLRSERILESETKSTVLRGERTGRGRAYVGSVIVENKGLLLAYVDSNTWKFAGSLTSDDQAVGNRGALLLRYGYSMRTPEDLASFAASRAAEPFSDLHKQEAAAQLDEACASGQINVSELFERAGEIESATCAADLRRPLDGLHRDGVPFQPADIYRSVAWHEYVGDMETAGRTAAHDGLRIGGLERVNALSALDAARRTELIELPTSSFGWSVFAMRLCSET